MIAEFDQQGSLRGRCAAGAICVAFLLGLGTSVSLAQDDKGTPAQRAACTPDAMHLCDAFIPDAARVKECLVEHIDGLSPACREVFEKSQKPNPPSTMKENK